MPRIGQLGLVLWITVTLVSLVSIAGVDAGEKAARMTSAPARPATVNTFVICSSLWFRHLRGAGGCSMEETLVRLYRMLPERAVHLPFRNLTYAKMANFCDSTRFKQSALVFFLISGVCTVHEKPRV